MKRFILILLLAGGLFGTFLPAFAQESKIPGMPTDVYYLMPSFTEGTVYFRGAPPARGKLNICAIDHSLRFLDENGGELQAADEEAIALVIIDTVQFLRHNGDYYRKYPVNREHGIALKRKVDVVLDGKPGAYGSVDRTSSIREYSNIVVDGINYEIGTDKEYPYKVNETVFLYNGNSVQAATKGNLKRLFPSRKAEIDAWFKQNKSFPKTADEARELLAIWAQEP